MKAAALAYAVRLGLHVFPVGPDCRRPLTRHGVKDATADPGEISRLWSAYPAANIAIACGSASGVCVLDVDVHVGGADGLATLAELEGRHGALPTTWRTITPSGGRHVWFRQPPRQLRNRVGFVPGLDIRTSGGSVAVPPSKKPTGSYCWGVRPTSCPLAAAPEWLLALIDPPAVPRPASPPIRMGSLDRLARYAASAIDSEYGELAAMGPHTGRNMQLFKAAARLGEIVGAGLAPESMVEDALEGAAADCGLIREDGRRAVLATIKSGLARGIAQPRRVAA